jgi:hypothetical protein
MKRTIATLVLGLTFTAASFAQTSTPASPSAVQVSTPPEIDIAHQATEQQVREYFALLGLDKAMKDLLNQTFKAMQTTSAPYLPNSLWADMQKTFQEYDLVSELVPVYQRHISREDMASALAFYHTDAGKHMLAAQPVMVAESQTKFRDIGRKLGEEVGLRHADEIVAAKKKYDDEIIAKQNSSKKQD